jgi:tetratricopeptide (TPR) repeat protein
MDAYGAETERIVGYSPPRDFLRRLGMARQADQVLADMFRLETASEDDPEFLMDFGDLLRNMGTYDAALTRYEKAGELDKGNRLGIGEEAAYAMAECCMLAGEHKEAGRRFVLFAASYPASENAEVALLLGARCCEEAGDWTAAIDALGKYLLTYRDGPFRDLVRTRREALKSRG